MQRPLSDVRPIGPFSVKRKRVMDRVLLTKEDEDREFILTFNTAGNVEKFGNPESSSFAAFVKAAMRESTILFRTAFPTQPNKSPFQGDSYKAIGIMQDESSLNVSKLKDSINKKVEGELPSEFMVEDITIELRG